MIGMRNPSYQTCEKCHYQSEIPQTSDCLIGVWKECPKCGSEKWRLKEKNILKNIFRFILNQ